MEIKICKKTKDKTLSDALKNADVFLIVFNWYFKERND